MTRPAVREGYLKLEWTTRTFGVGPLRAWMKRGKKWGASTRHTECDFLRLFCVERAVLRTLLPAKRDNERNRNVLAKALIAGGHPRIIVRSDGEPPMLARVRAVRVVATLADAPLQCDPRASEQQNRAQEMAGQKHAARAEATDPRGP